MASPAFTADSLFVTPEGLRITEISFSGSSKQIKISINHQTFAEVQCVWNDGHESVYTAEWLYIRRFTEQGHQERDSTLCVPRHANWKDYMEIQRASYEQVTESDAGFEHFGSSLLRDGIFIITDTPDRFVAEEFCKKVGSVIYETHYGRVFIVESVPQPENAAYTTSTLPLHVDLPYITACPQIQYLHCLIPAVEGGENIMADAVKAAGILRKRYPEFYKVLRDMKVYYEDVISVPDQTHRYLFNSKQLIVEDDTGEIDFIQWSPTVMSGLPNWKSAREFEAWMEALMAFNKIVTEECSIKIKCKAGDILVFDNRRVMHNREEYSSQERRKLEGFYTSWDFIVSRLRVGKIRQLEN